MESEEIGEERARKEAAAIKRDKDSSKRFIVAVILCMFTGIAAVSGLFLWFKKGTVNKTEMTKILEAIKENQRIVNEG